MNKTHQTFYWQYRDQHQKLLMIIARYDEGDKKWFRPFIKTAQGKWIEKAVDKPYPLFGLHELPHDDDATIFICEGEKCAQALLYLGLHAVTSPFGSSSAKQCDWSVLQRYRQLVLLPDNDSAGEKYAKQVLDLVEDRDEVYICNMPMEEKGSDVVDWMQRELKMQGSDWDGLSPLDISMVSWLKERFVQMVQSHQQLASVMWPVTDPFSSGMTFEHDPQPLGKELLAVQPVPMEYFPEPFKEWSIAHSTAMQVPLDFLTIPLIITVGTLIGRRRAVSPSPYDPQWIEIPNNYGMMIGKPSVMKSPALSRVLHFLNTIDDEGRTDYLNRLEEYKQEFAIYKELLVEAGNKIRKERAREELFAPINYDKYTEYLPEEPLKPDCRRYKTEDPTIQKLSQMLKQNPQGLLIHRDELFGFLRSLDKNGNEGDRSFYLEGWNGKNHYTVDRIGRGTVHIPALCLSMIGGIQPGPLRRYVHEAIDEREGNDGFLQRFQLSVWPDLTHSWKPNKQVVLPELDRRLETVFHRLSQLNFDPDYPDQYKPLVMTFDNKAQTFFNCWRYHFENRLRKNEMPDYLVSHLAKQRKTLPTLALLFAFMESEEPHLLRKIDSKYVEAAIHWCDYLESHARRIYQSGIESRHYVSARELFKRIKNRELEDGFTLRTIYHQKHWLHLNSKEKVGAAIDVLETLNWLRREEKKGVGRPTVHYHIHPSIYN